MPRKRVIYQKDGAISRARISELVMADGRQQGESRFYTATDGLRLHLRDYDPGPTPHGPVVCLAGLTRSADDFDRLAQALAFASTKPRRVIAFDYRGRGQSDHDPDWRRYSLPIEQADILTGLDLCGIDRAHFIGTSRGGLHIMAMASSHRDLFRSVVLNDIGPVLEPAGLMRIKTYVGAMPTPRSLDEAIGLLKASNAGLHFTGLDADEWRIFATTTFGTNETKLAPRYDPLLARVLDAFDLSQPLPDLWPQYNKLEGLPVLTIRGENSDLLSPGTCEAMAARWPGCAAILCQGQGHAPLLADKETIEAIGRFLAEADRAG